MAGSHANSALALGAAGTVSVTVALVGAHTATTAIGLAAEAVSGAFPIVPTLSTDSAPATEEGELKQERQGPNEPLHEMDDLMRRPQFPSSFSKKGDSDLAQNCQHRVSVACEL